MKLDKLITPRAGSLLVKRVDVEEYNKTKSGIYLNPTEEEKSSLALAEVVKVGDDFLNYKMECKEGDIIAVTETVLTKANYFVVVDDVKYFIINERDYYWGKI